MLPRLALLSLAACGRLDFAELPPRAWTITSVPGASDPAIDEEDPNMSSAATELYFANTTLGNPQLYVMTRTSPTAPWSAPSVLSINASADQGESRLSPDDLTIYFGSNRAGGAGSKDIWTATRTAVGADWSAPVNLAEVNTSNDDQWLSPCAGGQYVMARKASDLYEGTLGTAAPQIIAELDTVAKEKGPYLMPDCLTLYFNSDRDGTQDLYVTHRASVDAPWDPPEKLDDFNTPDADEEDPWMSADGHTVVFTSTRAGSYDIYIATR